MKIELQITRFGDVRANLAGDTSAQIAVFTGYGQAIRLLQLWFPGCTIRRIK